MMQVRGSSSPPHAPPFPPCRTTLANKPVLFPFSNVKKPGLLGVPLRTE